MPRHGAFVLACRRLIDDHLSAPELAIRDQLSRLLDDAARTVGTLVAAVDRNDGTAARSAVAALGPLGDRLDDFARGHQP